MLPWALSCGLLEAEVKTWLVNVQENVLACVLTGILIKVDTTECVVLLIQTGLIALGKLKGVIIIIKGGNCNAKAQFVLCGDVFKRWEQLVLCAL